MISCQLYGRLGNQLFQCAATIGYALRNNLPYAIPRHITRPPGLPADPIYFNHFPEVKDIIVDPESFQFSTVYYELPDQSYREINPVFTDGMDLLLCGYFQSEKYFGDQREGLLKVLQPAFTMSSSDPDEGRNYVSLHVRRGDYLDKPECHPVLPMSYYVQVIRYFNSKGFYRFVVFSDDMEWCKEEINKERFVGSRFIYSVNQSALEDLQSMKACRHNIIANSSFSWWGAWLNNWPDKIVIAPKQWYGPALSHINTKDLLPEKWITI